MLTSSERPIFVVGAPRSGTTLLRFILSMHPNIYIPPESNFILRCFQCHPQRSMERQQAIEIVNAILSYQKFFKDWQERERPVASRFVDALPNRTPATILDALYSQYARQHDAVRWGDKSPIYTDYIDEIAQIFPSAQFIHIIRDGRDVALSMLKAYTRRRFFYMNLCFAARTWKRRVLKACASGTQLGDERYYALRYEDLTAQPESTLQDICTYLGEAYVPTMLEPNRQAGKAHHSTGIYAATLQPITAQNSRRWHTEMSKTDQRLFQTMAGDLLDQLGYETVHLGRMSLCERLRLAGLQTKYAAVDTGRRALQAAGVFHPASLLTRRP